MKTLAELKAERAVALRSANAVLSKADGENREMNETEQALFDQLTAEAKDLEGKIEAKEKELSVLKAKEDLKKQVADLDKVDNGTTVPPNSNITDDAQKTIIGKVEDQFIKDPAKGFSGPREFLSSVMGLRGRDARLSNDKRIKYLAAINYDKGFQAAVGSDEQGVYDDAVGGVFVPEAFTPEYLRTAPEPDFTGMRTRNLPMGKPVVNIPARVDKNHSTSVSGGFTVSRRSETTAFATSRAKFENVKLEAESLVGAAYATEELLADSPQSFVAIIADGFRDEFQSHLTNERFNGTGVGEYLGILNAGNDALITVAAEDGQATSTIVYDNLLKIMARSWRFGTGNGLWVANPTCIPQLGNLNLSVGTGGAPIFIMDARERFPASLFGQPLVFSEYVPALGSAGCIGYYNFNEYLEGVYQPTQSAESVHVRFLNHERTFKFWTRNAGAPWWRTALTPKNGDTLSPFVTLGAVT